MSLVWLFILLTVLPSLSAEVITRPETEKQPSSRPAIEELTLAQRWNDLLPLLQANFQKDSKSFGTVMELATTFMHLGRRVDALTTLSQALSWADPKQKKIISSRLNVISKIFFTNRIFQIYQDGLNFMLSKKYRNARERFEKALAEEPENTEILLRLGQCFLFENDSKNAELYFQQAKKWNSQEPYFDLWLGRSLFQAGNQSGSLEILKTAQDQIKNSQLAPLWLAEGLSAASQTAASLRVLDRDSKQFPFHIMSLLQAAKIRLHSVHPDSQTLWRAQRDLQLALSRIDQYANSNQPQLEFEAELWKSPSELKGEIQKLMSEVQNRLNELQPSAD